MRIVSFTIDDENKRRGILLQPHAGFLFRCYQTPALDSQLRRPWIRPDWPRAGSGRKRRPSHLRPVDTDERPRWYH
jgi:hypothetical protein